MSKNKLPDKLSDLIRIAIKDVKQVEKQKDKYIVDMLSWHIPSESKKKCYVCLAGSVMACTLKTKPLQESYPDFYDQDTEQKLIDIDSIRIGELNIYLETDIIYFQNQVDLIDNAVKEVNSLIKKNFNKITRRAPWNIYLLAADKLEKVGL